MFASLRSRLWLSYALVILAALFLTAIILALYLLRSPLAYRPSFAALEAARAGLVPSQEDLATLPVPELERVLADQARALQVRLVMLDSGRQVLADSGGGTQAGIIPPRRFQLLTGRIGLQDESGQPWLYLAQPMPEGRTLLLMIPRPRLPLLALLRNELFLPFLYAGALALLLSLFVAFGLARWISSPLQGIIGAARKMPEAGVIRLSGPREVQELAGAFNEMSARVSATQKAQREFVANVSHELKTPITSIRGFAQALQDGTATSPEERQQAADIIQTEAERMHRLVLDLLDLTRIDSGTLDLQCSLLSLPALLESIAEKFAPQAQAAQVSIRVESEALPPLHADGDRLSQVLSNLVDNALKFTPPGGSISLRAGMQAEWLRVEVADTGAGIPAEALPHIFKRFFQVDPSRAGGVKHGAGLGLAIVREIVSAHGGTISVQSQPGEGSTFTILLPPVPPDARTITARRKKQP